MLDHTAKRLLVNIFNELKTGNYILKCKWGFDGSSGFSEYKQSTLSGSSDSSLFVTSMLPICLTNEVNNQIIWQNPACSSTRYCRPIRLQYAKETTELSLNEEMYISQQINQLTSYIHDKGAVKFSMNFTMIDGKICNVVSETSSMTCYVCKSKILQMNNLERIKNLVVDPSNYRYLYNVNSKVIMRYFIILLFYRFGLSTLHAYIGCFECLLHVSYRLDFKQ